MPPPSAIPRRRSMMASSKTNIVAAASSSSPSSLGARFESPRINRHRCALLERSASEIRKRSGRGESDRRPMVTAAAVSAAASTSPSASSPPPPPPPPPSSPDADLVVVGAGASGLAAALAAHRRGNSVLVLEASGSVGGRVQTDVMTAPASSTPEGGGKGDSFLLDRGFQIFLTSYPTAKELLDYAELDLRPFYAGAAVRFDDRWSAVADPFRHPADALATLLPSHPIGSPLDKLRVGLLRAGLLLKTPRDADAPSLLLRGGEETTTLEALRNFGFSEEMVDRFFRPFLGGIFFDNELKTSSRLFEFVMRSLATGANCLPAEGGIGSVTRQMASKLPSGCIRLNSRVVGVEPSSVGSSAACAVLADGTRVRGRLGVVVATERDAAEELLGAASPLLTVAPSKQGKGVGTCCAYFDAPVAPLGGAPMLMLNGELLAGKGGGGGAGGGVEGGDGQQRDVPLVGRALVRPRRPPPHLRVDRGDRGGLRRSGPGRGHEGAARRLVRAQEPPRGVELEPFRLLFFGLGLRLSARPEQRRRRLRLEASEDVSDPLCAAAAVPPHGLREGRLARQGTLRRRGPQRRSDARGRAGGRGEGRGRGGEEGREVGEERFFLFSFFPEVFLSHFCNTKTRIR